MGRSRALHAPIRSHNGDRALGFVIEIGGLLEMLTGPMKGTRRAGKFRVRNRQRAARIIITGNSEPALTASITKLSEQLRKTLTWDRGKELSGHAQFALETCTQVFFADPHSPWQRPSNENTNGLLRQYFPKRTDLSRWSAEDLEAVAYALNNRPRKDPRLEDPSRSLREQLRSLQQPGVASTS